MQIWSSCFQWFKDTNLKANYNQEMHFKATESDVFDTNLKANHNDNTRSA